MELTRQLLPQMRERHSGLIISVSSIGAVRGALGNGYYSAAKGALELACEALAKEVQPLGIRVMLAEPGALRTGFYGERLKSSPASIADYDALAGKYRKNNKTDSRQQLFHEIAESLIITAFRCFFASGLKRLSEVD